MNAKEFFKPKVSKKQEQVESTKVESSGDAAASAPKTNAASATIKKSSAHANDMKAGTKIRAFLLNYIEFVSVPCR
jgi:hypothetical protein